MSFAKTAAGVLFAAMLLPAHAAPDIDAIAGDIEARNNRVITQLQEAKAADNLSPAVALRIIQREISPVLSFERLTRRAMGKHWKKTPAETRARVIAAFRALLENTYAKVLSQYKDQAVTVLGGKVLPRDAVSVSVEVQGGGKSAVIDYIFSGGDDGAYRVGDIKVEGISLVTNYRRQFNRIIKKSGGDGLVAELEALAAKKSQ